MPFYVWWAIPLAATLLTVGWLSWRSRERAIDPRDSMAARRRFEEALREPPKRRPTDSPTERGQSERLRAAGGSAGDIPGPDRSATDARGNPDAPANTDGRATLDARANPSATTEQQNGEQRRGYLA